MKVPEKTTAFIRNLSELDGVLAVGLGGSRASGAASMGSDYDLYVFTSSRIDPHVRKNIITPLADSEVRIEIANPYWGDEDGFTLSDVWHDVVYFDANWFHGEIDRVINQHLAREGYSTSFVFTLVNMMALHDPAGLIATWQREVREYPTALARAIISHNYQVSCVIHACYRNQIARAANLADPVAVNHRVAAFLACVFDIVFAHLQLWHPGEKRQLPYLREHAGKLPAHFEAHVREVLTATSRDRLQDLIPAVNRLADTVSVLARQIPEVER